MRKLQRIKIIGEHLSKTSMSRREQRRIKFALFNDDVYDEFLSQMDSESQHLLTGRPISEIDWENFDWEKAADFWVKLIEAVAKIILAVI